MAKNILKLKKIMPSSKAPTRSQANKSRAIVGAGIYSPKKIKFNGGKSGKRR